MSTQSMTDKQMVNLTIDGKAVAVPKGTTVYTAAQQLEINIPIFCYHDRMPPFGACRMCLVEVEKMGKPQTSCTLEATEGMVVHTHTAMAADGRKEILEFLLINHPLDCPICDRGGECPLQDNTMAYGPGRSRFYEEKQHFKKPIPLGPVLMLDRERCIVCARCTRFSDEIAGDHALEFIERGYKTEVGTPDGGPAVSKYIGNTIMLCPVGALTSRVYRFRARPWDNEATQSSCTLCPVGCSLYLDSRDGEIMRTRSCENRALNDIWLCDKGWFGYEFTEHFERLQKPLVRRSGKLELASWEEALALIAAKIIAAKPSGRLAAFGGNPLTLEENDLFQKLMRKRIGVNHLDHRIGMPVIALDDEVKAPGMEISIGECEELSYAVLCGVDLTEEFPVIWLRLRQAINKGAKVIFLGHFAPEISQLLTKIILHAPGAEVATWIEQHSIIAELAKEGEKGALFVGRQYLANPQRSSILKELIKFQKEYPNLSLNILEGRGNSMGARLAGMRPDLGAGGEKLAKSGLSALQVLEEASSSGWDYLHVAGANPVVKFPAQLWSEARAKLGFLVVQDLFLTETAQQADVVLPALSFVEKHGSMINITGDIQKLQPGKAIPAGVYSDGEIFLMLSEKLAHVEFERQEIRNTEFNPTQKYAASVNSATGESLLATFAHCLFDEGARMLHNPHLIQLAKEPRVRIHPLEGTKRGIQDNEKVRLTANGHSINVKIKLDSRVAANTIVLPIGFKQIPVYELDANLMNGLPIEIVKI